MKEGKVVSWLKAEGDAISAGEAIMVVESDKADMDVEAFEDGFLAAIITGEGEVSAVGSPVALIAENEADIPALQAMRHPLRVALCHRRLLCLLLPPDAPQGSCTQGCCCCVRCRHWRRCRGIPLAKKRAEELGLDISAIAGTGPNGRVTAGDVEAFASSGCGCRASRKAAPPAVAAAVWTPAPGVVAATPTARALAKKAKLDISKTKGRGSNSDVSPAGRCSRLPLARKNQNAKSLLLRHPGAAAVEVPSGLRSIHWNATSCQQQHGGHSLHS
jgi:pyruvate dehydrogenase E2 component (dihydrolipoamide acetyltransferase)